MASGYLALTSRYWRISAVVASRPAPGFTEAAGSAYSFAAAGRFLAAGLAAGFARSDFRRLRRAFSFLWRVLRRIFIDRRLSRFPIRLLLARTIEKRRRGVKGGSRQSTVDSRQQRGWLTGWAD